MSRVKEHNVSINVGGSAETGAGGNPRLAWARGLCATGAGVSIVGLAGWILDVPVLRSVVPGAVEMKVNTALCLGLLAFALCLRSSATSGFRILASRILAASTGVIGLITLLEYGLDWNAGIDELLFRDTAQAYNPAPGRMSPFSALAFLLMGAGLVGPVSMRWRGVVIVAALLTCAIGCISIMGYALGASELTTDYWAPPVALNTASVLCALGMSSLLIDPLVADFWHLPKGAGSLHTKLVVGFGCALLLLCAGGAFAYRIQQRSTESNAELSRAGEIRHALRSISLTMADAENAQRNFLLLAIAAHRDQFHESIELLNRQRDRLVGLMPQEDPDTHQLATLSSLMLRWQLSLAEHIVIAERDGLGAATAAIAAGTSFRDHAALRELTDSMDVREQERIAELSREAVKNRNYTLAAMIATVAVATLTLVLFFLSIMRDLRERVRVAAALRGARTEAQRATQAKSDFLAAMSHEIRTPMNGVIGMLDLLEQSSLQNQQQEMVRLTRESADSLLGIIEDILDFSKIEAGRMELERTTLPISTTVERACLVLDRLAERQGVQLLMYCDPALPESVIGDPTRLRQILINLVNNAIKFSSGQGRAGVVSIRSRLVESDAQKVLVEFSVNDNGIGMDAATVAGLFTPFMQADLSTTRRFGGTGLGLAISHQMVTLMGGRIDVESQPGVGTTFTMQIPFDRAAASPLPAATALEDVRCLVVGHNGGMAGDLASYLAAEGATVQRIAQLPKAGDPAAEQLPRGRATVWVVESDDTQDPVGDLLYQAENSASDAGIVLVVVGRKRRIAPAIAERHVIINGNALPRAALVHAVKVATGSVPAVRAPAVPVRRMQRREMTREEALKRNQLVLVAEDNATNQKVVLKQLRLLGYAADIATNGELALRMWQSGEYALLLTDLHMPKLDGYDLALAIRTASGEASRRPIVALTANALPGEDERCREAGMNGYLTKPVTLSDLESVLQRWLPQPPDFPPLNLEVLFALVGEDPGTVRDLLQDYRGGAAALGSTIDRAAIAGRAMEVATAAHTLKSSSRSIGALPLGALCEQLEQSGQAADLPSISKLVGALQAELDRVLAAIDSELAQRHATGTDA
jgi:signal transduction histidine kinase/HPt (histidine-containing phosphotransfer) domain-containing protein